MKKNNKLLVTGASGFVGSGLRAALIGSYKDIIFCARRKPLEQGSEFVVSPTLDCDSNWEELLKEREVVVHLAGRAHVLKEHSTHPLDDFRKSNVAGTIKLARQALVAGVKRFVFISSIGVNGSHTVKEAFTELSPPSPHADYAVSKYEAEQELRNLVQGSGMELVIIRPPLVYAAHAPGNFAKLLEAINLNMPLPFSSVKNHRSMVALENLAGFIAVCIDHPAAADQTFLISDGVSFSTPDIIRYIAEGMGHKANLFPVPLSLMRFGANILGRKSVFQQLCSSLVVDSSKARDLLGWKPVVNSAEALVKAGYEFKVNVKNN